MRRLGLGRATPERGSKARELGSLEPISDGWRPRHQYWDDDGLLRETKETKETIDEVSLVACKSECAIEVCKGDAGRSTRV